MMYIYKITHINSEKSYIGQTTKTVSTRFKQHCKSKGGAPLLRNALNKYGNEAFTVDTLAKCETREELDAAEKYFIKLFNTIHPHGYNLTDGGRNPSFIEHSGIEKFEPFKEIKKMVNYMKENNLTKYTLGECTIILKNHKETKESETDPAFFINDELGKMPSDSDLLLWSTDSYEELVEGRKGPAVNEEK